MKGIIVKENEMNRKSFNSLSIGTIDERYMSFLRRLAGFLFRKIELDIESTQNLQEYSGKGTLIYASFHTKSIALMLLYNVLKRGNFETPVLALGCNPSMFQPVFTTVKSVINNFTGSIFGSKRESALVTDRIEELIKEGKSIYLSVITRRFFNKKDLVINNDLLECLIDIQRRIDTPIHLLQEMVFWNMNQERSRSIIASNAAGDRGIISGWITILKSLTPAFVRVSRPVNLKDEVEKSVLYKI